MKLLHTLVTTKLNNSIMTGYTTHFVPVIIQNLGLQFSTYLVLTFHYPGHLPTVSFSMDSVLSEVI